MVQIEALADLMCLANLIVFKIMLLVQKAHRWVYVHWYFVYVYKYISVFYSVNNYPLLWLRYVLTMNVALQKSASAMATYNMSSTC